jgi:hypothetical protein
MVYVNNSDELYHYGVKGMRWGHRKASYQNTATSGLRQRYDAAKADKKAANKAYKKAFNKAYNRSYDTYSLSKKRREASNARWNDAAEKGAKSYEADRAFKQVKKERKEALKSTHKQLNKEASFKDKLLYGDGTRKKAAKYIVDNNMSVSEATKKANSEAIRNTAVVLGAYGAVAVGAYLKSRS